MTWPDIVEVWDKESVPACVSDTSFARKPSNAFPNRFQVYAPLGFETLLLVRQRLLRRCGLEMNASHRNYQLIHQDQESNVGAKNVELTEAKDELQKGLQVGVRAANHFSYAWCWLFSPVLMFICSDVAWRCSGVRYNFVGFNVWSPSCLFGQWAFVAKPSILVGSERESLPQCVQALQQTRPQHLALREEVMAELTGLEMAWDRGVVPSNLADFFVKHGAPLDCMSRPTLGATRKRLVGDLSRWQGSSRNIFSLRVCNFVAGRFL